MTTQTLDPIGISPRLSGLELLDFRQLFGNSNPVVLEIGSGKGRFLLNSAAARPDVNFIGIEKSLHYHRVIVHRTERAGLANVRVINHDAFAVLSRMFPSGSLSEIHIYFPDPWPRPRERKRRLIREEVLEQMERVLSRTGFGVYVTDYAEYFEKSVPLLSEFFSVEAGELRDGDPRTNYEAKYRQQGRRIYQITFRKR
jgi:tRNA (guanine-N7-)-methyltransferase